MHCIHIWGIEGVPEIRPGDNLAGILIGALRDSLRRQVGNTSSASDQRARALAPGCVLVIAQKVVSKAEGSVVALDTVDPSPEARAWGTRYGKDPRLIEVILRESKRVVRMDRGVLIAETRHGYVCANAGVDTSNAPKGCVVLLPSDPDASARRLRQRVEEALGLPVGVLISDTFGRPWRQGLTNVALGLSGVEPFIDYRGQADSFGRTLQATLLAVADELAGAAELVMGKTAGIPAAVIEGFRTAQGRGSGRDLLRPPEEDLFR